MRLALHNPFPPDAPWAERELALRMEIALDGMGWDCRIVNTVEELEDFAPDSALCLHPQAVPKMSAVPSLGCHWNPPSAHWQTTADALANELSHDGFLTAGAAVERRLRDILWGTGRPVPTMPFYPSSQGWALAPTLNADSRFFYVGSNWDGRRFPVVLETLARRRMLALHGQAGNWGSLADAFMGPLPFDGHSVIESAHARGMGLCLHLPAHLDAGIPNMRVFELCAAGALIVADRHPFIVEHFGDTVLYVDTAPGEEAAAEQILAHGAWARSHPALGRDMAKAAQAIFLQRFSLEKLLAPLPDLLGAIRRSTGHGPAPVAGTVPVSVVIPIGEEGIGDARARLAALNGQTAKPAEVIIAGPGAGILAGTAARSAGTAVSIVELPDGRPEGSALWAGGRATTQAWVTWLPEGTRPFPEHLATLYATASFWETASVIHADVLEPAPAFHDGDAGDNGLFHKPEKPWRLAPAGPRPHPAGMMVARDRLPPLLRDDPGLGAGGAWLLARRLAPEGQSAGECRRTHRTTARARAETALAPAERERLGRFDLLRARPAEDGAMVRPAPSLPWTGPSDLDARRAELLPRLLDPIDFARLPRDRAVYIYGASRGGRLLQLELAKWNHVSVAGFLDGSRRGEAWGLPVRQPEDVPEPEIASAVIVIANQYVGACAERLSRMLSGGEGKPALYNAYPYIHRHCSAESGV